MLLNMVEKRMSELEDMTLVTSKTENKQKEIPEKPSKQKRIS